MTSWEHEYDSDKDMCTVCEQEKDKMYENLAYMEGKMKWSRLLLKQIHVAHDALQIPEGTIG